MRLLAWSFLLIRGVLSEYAELGADSRARIFWDVPDSEDTGLQGRLRCTSGRNRLGVHGPLPGLPRRRKRCVSPSIWMPPF